VNGYLLDTNVISEASRPKPNRAVLKWLEGTADGRLFLSAITVGELRRGASLLPESEKRAHYGRIILALQEQFEERILAFDVRAADVWGNLDGGH
jgi:predicted nucleic acid-binding protein